MRKTAGTIAWLTAGLLLGCGRLFSQDLSLPGSLYDPSANELLFPGNSKESWKALFRSFDSLVRKGDRSIHFLHIGDSHIQAGFLPEALNRELSDLLAPGCGARGFIFPYRVAKSNNPVNYSVKFTGNWDRCRNVEVNKNCDLGLAGIVVSTSDSVADLHLLLKPVPFQYDFNRLRIWYDADTSRFLVRLPAMEGHYSKSDSIRGITDLHLDGYVDSLWIRIVKKDTLPGIFSLYGMEAMNGDPGIIYSAAGVNGAEFSSFLRCSLLEKQLREIGPQCLVVSLGTNDAYATEFDQDTFAENARRLIRTLKGALPGVPILVTTPGDCYRKRRYDNKNLAVVRDILIKTAADEDCAVWDFYTVMGGPASMMTWYKAGLAARDKIHFSKAGYCLQADLLYQAIRDAWFSFLDKPGK
jgi:lysophospholipase L1-like esterase